jgi:polyhydroxyalkanoate synthase
MTIADHNPDSQPVSRADLPVDFQGSKKLEKSLDAVAALRHAMEKRLATARAAQQASESLALSALLPVAEAEPVAEALEEAAQFAAEHPEPPRTEAPPVETPKPTPSQASSPLTPPPQSASQPPPPGNTSGQNGASGNGSNSGAPPDNSPKPDARERRHAEAKPDPGPAPELPPINLDPLKWMQILLHVAEGCQQLIRDYILRMRDKPLDTIPFTPTPIVESFSELSAQIINDPEAFTTAQIAVWQNYLDLTRATLMKMQGFKMPTAAMAAPLDKRFQSRDWQSNWMFDFIKQTYLMSSDEARKFVQQESSVVDRKLSKKIEFYTRLFLDATAPSNFWLTNPEVLRATLDSGGDNLIQGFQNLLEDMESGNGMLRIRMSDYHAFEIGTNIAATPGKVVFQNELMQLIQYAPMTASVKRVPLLIIPPWINKYYILDLREKNSYVHYLVAQGFTVFCISWVNPTKRHALTQFEDYMDKGALTALREVKRLTGVDEAMTVGYCIGGTLLATTQAYLAALPEPREDLPKIVSSTYLVTMVDFANPGDLGVFIDEDQIRMLEDRMARQGYMDAGSMMLTFNLLRANDLIWPFVINNYLLGREPFPFDILYWNTDSTNLPAAMQSYYLRKMYLDNKLIEPGALKMRGVPIDIAEISTPSFLLATRDDHIAPWRSTYAATQYYKGPVTFVLSGSGHIAGVVNPPAAEKYGYWTNAECPEDPEEWVTGATAHKGSWWPEWVKWLNPYAGADVPARAVTEGIEDAPGSYVKVRAV